MRACVIWILVAGLAVCVIGEGYISASALTHPVLPGISPDPSILPTDETISIAIPDDSSNSSPTPSGSPDVDQPPAPPIAIPDESSSSPAGPPDTTDLNLASPPGSDMTNGPDSSNSAITSDACTEAMTNICKLGNSYSFEESLRCLESHVNELRGACSVALNVMMSNLYSDCGETVSTLCSDTSSSSGSDESVYVLSCLSNHENELSPDCQQQLDTYLNEEYPCTKEASLFCSEKTYQTPEQTLGCLEMIATTSPYEISPQCANILHGFSSCKDGPDGEGPGDSGRPGPKPKPRARYLSASSAISSASDISTRSRVDKPKPKPEPKSKPERRCWPSRDRESGGPGSFLEGLSGLGGHSASDSSDADSMSTGVVMSSLIVVLVLVGVAAVKYRQSQEDNLHTNSGYWRAPSIQAMLFDDSAHAYGDESPLNGGRGGAGGGVVMSRVVEMEDLKSGTQPPTVEAIQVTVSPITHSDEIRV